MISANIVNVLARTLQSTTIDSSSLQLKRMRNMNGFTIQLLIISDDVNQNIAIRQSAIIYLKNIVQDHCTQSSIISNQDIDTLKQSLLQAMIRNVTNKQLAPTLKQIIFQLAEKYYPRQWPEIVDDAIKRLAKAVQFSQILGCVQALRAVISVFGGSITKQIQLSNVCNKSILPLLGLLSNLFQNFNADTVVIMMSIFKLISTIIHFHLPPIIQVNIHNLMIFVKKILDLNVVLDDSNSFIYSLKKINLRILFRIYQRHANIKLTDNKNFAIQFQNKYTKPFVETLLYQIMSDVGKDKSTKHRQMQLIKLSLSCLAYVNRQHPQAATLLLHHRNSIIQLCLQKFKMSFSRSYQNFIDFKMSTQENRVHLKEFFFSLMRCEAIPQHQGDAVTSLLSLLLNCLQNGDNELKELTLYIFGEMSAQIQFLNTSLDDNMTLLIVSYVRPLLSSENHIMVRTRACQLLSNYNYLQIPEEHLIEIATLVYNCLLVGNSQKQTFLKIYACNAFNSILKYSSIVEFVKPHLQDILRIYTSLLEADVTIIKNFEDVLNLLQDQIAPFANDLVLLLINLFHNYSKQDSSQAQINNNNYGNSNNQDNQDEDDESVIEQDDNNNENIAKSCISSIRQILQAQRTEITNNVREELFTIVINIFVDRSQLYIQEGYNILNLLLYKLKDNVDPKYYIFFKIIIYAILGVPPNYIASLKKGSQFDRQFGEILQNICEQPDNDLLENSIGCIRNFIAKSTREMLWLEKDDFNIPMMQYLFKTVKFVHENTSGKSSQTDRLIILTIYITLVEYKVLSQPEVVELLNTVIQWMQMQQEVIQQNNNGASKSNKYIYSSIYLQIIMLGINFYGNVIINQLNINYILGKIVYLQDNFKCDYEISRIIIGISVLLEQKCLSDSNTVTLTMNALPELVRKLCKFRQQGDNQLNDLEMDDEAEQEKFFGDDQNSLMIGWQQNKLNPTNKDLLLKELEQDEEDNDWEEQFNKFYDSPFDKIDEIRWLQNVLKGQGNCYCSYMTKEKTQELALYFANAPCKNQ